MESIRLYQVRSELKWAATAYIFLSMVGFGVAALMSYQHYGLDHAKTATYFLGSESEMAFPKLYAQLLQTAHVHSFTMPVVFLPLWIGLNFTPLASKFKKLLIVGASLSILLYNAGPFLLRYYSVHAAWCFSLGGTGLFGFFFASAFVLLYETWLGFSRPRAS